ncbi:acyltransferase family protein [Sphingobium sp. H39-3-25]|uniref:acyltransferase family protein n=1 Tax=Sphingobium arseniciresistens TaxID=3030834 RepID=UPI0023B8DF24|nr:acyltransferase family protein [Sphingobium arseniciresistens]
MKKNQITGISGLRMLAVLSVVLFHISSSWLPGGFVGVDVFFVISGFVVAHSVYHFSGNSFKVYFSWFYRRRFSRILPAIFLFVIVTTLAGVLFIPQAPASKTIEITGISAIFGVSNFALLFTSGDYFSTSTEYNTFTHTWSLAVEEQYYFLFPFISYALIVNSKNNDRKRSIYLFSLYVLVLLSLISCYILTEKWRSAAFYMLPTRFWELGIGFLLRYQLDRFSLTSVRTTRSLPVEALALSALASLLLSFWLASADSFPFPWALLPCGATAVLIAILWLRPGTLTDRLLSLRPCVFLGNISYSLYLWHWGVLVLMRWTVGVSTIGQQAFALALMTLLACASYYVVERPLRYNRRITELGTPAFFVAYAAVAALCVGICFLLYIEKPKFGLSVANQASIWDPYAPYFGDNGKCALTTQKEEYAGGELWRFTPKCAGIGKSRLFVLGDSHAGAYQRMIARTASIRGQEALIYTYGGCSPIQVDERPLLPGCASFRTKVLKEILAKARAGDTLLLPRLYTPRFRGEWDEDIDRKAIHLADARPLAASAATIARTAALLKPLADKGIRLIIEAPKPTLPTSLYRCGDWFNRESHYCTAGWNVLRVKMEQRAARPMAAVKAIANSSSGISIWDPFPILCPGKTCNGYLDGKPLYFDTDHLSAFGNDVLLPSFLRAIDSSAMTQSVKDGSDDLH